jgi:phage FluMu gp28-like protein
MVQEITKQGKPVIGFRPYQRPVFMDRSTGILVLHWSRQIGKSFTLASWAVDRLLTQLKGYDSWLITVLSNSRDNGAEFVIKCQEVCRKLGAVMETRDDSPDLTYNNMRMEVRITLGNRTGRIKVLAANPRTARGFSGDLILDEFAFHEDSQAIWEAAEPILSSNPEFMCRIASTGNGKHNMFYRMAAGMGPNDGSTFTSSTGFTVSRVTRTEAWKQGVKVYDPVTRKPITPEEARKKALDKRAYDQNYECLFNDENMVLLTWELIAQAERAGYPMDEQAWSAASLQRLFRAEGELYLGQDVGRNRDLSVQVVIDKLGGSRRVLGLLRMSGMRLPDQQRQLDLICALPKFRRAALDMTGIGLGLTEYAQERWGAYRVFGVNFSSTEAISNRLRQEGRKQETARVTEIMATDLLGCFEDRTLELHVALDQEAREDLRKPERVVSSGGRVSIAATRDEAGHADHFWGLALAIRASMNVEVAGNFVVGSGKRARVMRERRERVVMG